MTALWRLMVNFEARDGWAVIIADTQQRFEALCDVLGLEKLRGMCGFRIMRHASKTVTYWQEKDRKRYAYDVPQRY